VHHPVPGGALKRLALQVDPDAAKSSTHGPVQGQRAANACTGGRPADRTLAAGPLNVDVRRAVGALRRDITGRSSTRACDQPALKVAGLTATPTVAPIIFFFLSPIDALLGDTLVDLSGARAMACGKGWRAGDCARAARAGDPHVNPDCGKLSTDSGCLLQDI
jgi:hypothetical protein